MFIIKHKLIFFILGIILVGGSIVVMIVNGFNVGVDFTGGSVLEVTYDDRPATSLVKAHIVPVQQNVELQEVGTNGLIVRTVVIDQAQKDALLTAISFDGAEATEKRFNTI